MTAPEDGSMLALDLDETLIHSYYDRSEVAQLKRLMNESDGESSDTDGVLSRLFSFTLPGNDEYIALERPYLRPFLDWAFNQFQHVVIWSAGRKDYVEAVCQHLFPAGTPQPCVVYHWDHCLQEGDNFSKPLDHLRRERHLTIDPRRRLLVDDRPGNFKYNPEQGVLIPPWSPDLSDLHKRDYALPKLEAHLEEHALPFADFTPLPACPWNERHYLEAI